MFIGEGMPLDVVRFDQSQCFKLMRFLHDRVVPKTEAGNPYYSHFGFDVSLPEECDTDRRIFIG